MNKKNFINFIKANKDSIKEILDISKIEKNVKTIVSSDEYLLQAIEHLTHYLKEKDIEKEKLIKENEQLKLKIRNMEIQIKILEKTSKVFNN